MSGTVIDSLIVKLGLDPSDFTRGEKEVAAAVLKTKSTVNTANEGMASSFASLTKKFLGWATVVLLLKKLVSAASDLNAETRQLGIDSKNFGIAANQMRNFQNAAEMMGGKAEDVTRSIEGLQKAIFDLTVMGQNSAQLEMLTRLGVQFQDSTGHARNFHDVVLDTADALERAQKAGTLNRTEAYFAAKQSGFDEGTAQLILSGRKNAERELAAQEGRRQVQEADIASAAQVERLKTGAAQAITAKGIGAETATVHGVASTIDAIKSTAAALTAPGGLEHAAQSAAKALDRLSDAALAPLRRQSYQSAINGAAARYGVDPEMLAGLLKTESNFNPYAVSKAGAVGVAQLMPQYFPHAGEDPTTDIYTAANYLRTLHDSFIKSGSTDADAWKLAQQSYNAGQSRVRASLLPGGKPLPRETLEYPGRVQAAMAASKAGNTTVNVGPVTVNTQATDASGVARGLSSAVKRKMQAAQADSGQR